MKVFFMLILFGLVTGPVKTDNVLTRFKTPAGYRQSPVVPGSFAAWLQA